MPGIASKEDELLKESMTASQGAGTKASALRERSVVWLFWVIPGIPLALIAIAFFLVSTAFFRTYMDNDWIAAQRVVFETSNHPCDILIFGDSTAMVSLDPKILKGATQLSACNVGATRPTLALVGLDPLNKYLARNPRPKYLILQFGANLFAPMPYDRKHEESADGLVTVLRYYNPSLAVGQVVRHPSYCSTIAWIVYVDGAKRLFESIAHHHGRAVLADGYIVPAGKPLTSCALLDVSDRDPNSAWISYLRKRYSEAADQVIVNVTPTPSCNPLYSVWSRDLQGLTDNGLEEYPPTMFVDGMHLNRAGSIHFSDETAQQILRFEQKPLAEISQTQHALSVGLH